MKAKLDKAVDEVTGDPENTALTPGGFPGEAPRSLRGRVMSIPILYPYQKAWLEDDSRFKIGMFARQTGKTFTTTLEIALDMALAELEGRRTRWVILSRGERQARKRWRKG